MKWKCTAPGCDKTYDKGGLSTCHKKPTVYCWADVKALATDVEASKGKLNGYKDFAKKVIEFYDPKNKGAEVFRDPGPRQAARP